MELADETRRTRKQNWGKGQIGIYVKIDNKILKNLDKTCKIQGITRNRAINMAIFEFNKWYDWIE